MVSPHDFKTNLGYPFGDAFGWKKFAALLPNNWLAETPQALAPRRLGRQLAERERISEIDCNFFLKNKRETNLDLKYSLYPFSTYIC
jgi:hypothetical protein